MIYIMIAFAIAIYTIGILAIEYIEDMPVYTNPEVPPVPECPAEYKMN